VGTKYFVYSAGSGPGVLVFKSAGARSRLPTQTSGNRLLTVYKRTVILYYTTIKQISEVEEKNVHVVFQYLYRSQRWYFLKLIAPGGLFLGIDSSRGTDSAMELIHRRNWFLMYKNL
jgi:hypothetical protein